MGSRSKKYLKQNGSVIISMPNIAHNSIIFNLLNDNFPYAPTGLLDYTHIRFFTIHTFEKMVREAGLVVVKRNATYRHFKLKESEEEIFDRLDFDIVKAHLLGNVFQFVYEIKQREFYPDTYQSIESFCHENSFLKTKLYWTDEKDFSEKKTIISDLHIDDDGRFSLSFNVENVENIRRLRFDPVENIKISLHIDSIMLDNERSEIIRTNSGLSYKNEYVFFTKDPQVEFVPPRKKFVKVKIDGFIYFGKKYYNELLKHVEKLQHDKGEVERELTVSQTHIERLQHDKGEVERELKKRYAKYSTLRVDIRNKGAKGSNVIDRSVNPAPVSLRRPEWLKDGITIESVAGKMSVELQCHGDGELEVGLLGRDVRNVEGKRYPVWVDCTSFAVNGEVIINETKTVCHDKRYVYRRTVKDGEVIRLDMVWEECQSSNVLDEYRKLQTNLHNANVKVSSTETALNKATAKISSTESVLRKANAQIDSLKNQLLLATENNRKLEKKTQQLCKMNENLENSLSFKIGRIVTFLPRKIRDYLKS